jgi:hypothetical protein
MDLIWLQNLSFGQKAMCRHTLSLPPHQNPYKMTVTLEKINSILYDYFVLNV